MSVVAPSPTALFTTLNIGGLVADVILETIHTDRARITEHPIEDGAAISDHIIPLPQYVSLRGGWSVASPQNGGSTNYQQQMYLQLIALKEARIPFSITTRLRLYQNFVVESVVVVQNAETANTVKFTAVCRQVFIVSTMTTPGSTSPAVQQNPASNAPVQNGGNQQLGPAPNLNPGALPTGQNGLVAGPT